MYVLLTRDTVSHLVKEVETKPTQALKIPVFFFNGCLFVLILLLSTKRMLSVTQMAGLRKILPAFLGLENRKT